MKSIVFMMCALLLFKWAILPPLFHHIRLFHAADGKQCSIYIFPMIGFEPRTALPTKPKPVHIIVVIHSMNSMAF